MDEVKKDTRLSEVPDILKFESFKVRLHNGLNVLWKNKRLRFGLITLLIFAPFAKFAYLLFPSSGFGEYLIDFGPIQIPNTIEGPERDWYWGYIYQYVFSSGELLAPTISFFGLFLLFPRNYTPAYLAAVPFGYYMSMLTYRMFIVDTNENFLLGFPVTVTIAYLFLGFIIFLISSKLLSRGERNKQAIIDRIAGLIKVEGVPWKDKEEILIKEVDQMVKVENELFNRKTI